MISLTWVVARPLLWPSKEEAVSMVTGATVSHQDGGWVVEVAGARGTKVRYRYQWESQARYFAAVFSLNPSFMPVPERLQEQEAAPARSECDFSDVLQAWG